MGASGFGAVLLWEQEAKSRSEVRSPKGEPKSESTTSFALRTSPFPLCPSHPAAKHAQVRTRAKRVDPTFNRRLLIFPTRDERTRRHADPVDIRTCPVGTRESGPARQCRVGSVSAAKPESRQGRLKDSKVQTAAVVSEKGSGAAVRSADRRTKGAKPRSRGRGSGEKGKKTSVVPTGLRLLQDRHRITRHWRTGLLSPCPCRDTLLIDTAVVDQLDFEPSQRLDVRRRGQCDQRRNPHLPVRCGEPVDQDRRRLDGPVCLRSPG